MIDAEQSKFLQSFTSLAASSASSSSSSPSSSKSWSASLLVYNKLRQALKDKAPKGVKSVVGGVLGVVLHTQGPSSLSSVPPGPPPAAGPSVSTFRALLVSCYGLLDKHVKREILLSLHMLLLSSIPVKSYASLSPADECLQAWSFCSESTFTPAGDLPDFLSWIGAVLDLCAADPLTGGDALLCTLRDLHRRHRFGIPRN